MLLVYQFPWMVDIPLSNWEFYMNDIILRNGTIVDPINGIHALLDLRIRGGLIDEVGANIESGFGDRIINLSGKIVTPGIIDLHTHVYDGVSSNGVNPDLAGVLSGVTTVVDAGSAGSSTFGGFPSHVIPNSNTQIFSFLHIARAGLSVRPEISSRLDIELEETIDLIKSNKLIIQGVKVRAVSPGARILGLDLIKLAKEAANEGDVPLMVHIGDTDYIDGEPLTRNLLPLLDSGDIVTHLFTTNPGRIVQDEKIIPEIFEAQERGVFLDTAHGRLNFSFDVARRALDAGLIPDSISTDITLPGRLTTVYSMTEMMTRFLAFGFSVDEVVRMTTISPARALGMQDSLGTLSAGRIADISVLELVSGDWEVSDPLGNKLKVDKAFSPVMTFKSGKMFSPDWGPHEWGWLPNPQNG